MKDVPAFPSEERAMDDRRSGDLIRHSGMSLRDYFAAAALSGVMRTYGLANGPMIGSERFIPNCVSHAYKIADEMMRVREEEKR